MLSGYLKAIYLQIFGLKIMGVAYQKKNYPIFLSDSTRVKRQTVPVLVSVLQWQNKFLLFKMRQSM